MKKDDTSVPEFSLKPTHTKDPVDSNVLFGRKDSYNSRPQDDSPLPTSALPYIYNKQSVPLSRSVVSTSISPPMESGIGSDSEDNVEVLSTHMREQKRKRSCHCHLPLT
mmetsp:Transcript_23278/g.32614  ORF Transcript_23278/g.32614 Transcript_23278/m.32614 type:complete len:109 (-) Transcript_23278:43-369(-)